MTNKKIKLLTWNIRNGGGKEPHQTISTILEHQADLIVITEYQNKIDTLLRTSLSTNGYKCLLSSNPKDKENGIFIASKTDISISEGIVPQHDQQRWVSLYVPTYNVYVLAVHIPGAPDHKFVDGVGISGRHRKEKFWQSILEYASLHSQDKTIIMGDFNTGLKEDAEGAPFALSKYMRDLIKLGYADVWRKTHGDKREYTWYSQQKIDGITQDKNGFRLDYAFVSPPFTTNITASYHSHAERIAKISDHSSLIVEALI